MTMEIPVEQALQQLSQQAQQAIEAVTDLAALDQLRVHYLGKTGVVTQQLKRISSLPKEQRPALGQMVNQLKRCIAEAIEQRKQVLNQLKLQARLASETIDVTLPGRGLALGHRHPISQIRERVVKLFSSLGFNVKDGPELEDDFHNFTALNMPPYHPARAGQDTFYFDDKYLLRTQTSPVQIRTMETESPPLRIVTPGRVYRRDYDQTHTPMFHQLEGLVVDQLVTFADLKGLLHDFLNQFFEREVVLRFRPSYFPFTEPSAEVDVQFISQDTGEKKWLEVLGCGMVHPNVFRNVKIDPEIYQGFAFGLGLDRLTMLYYQIEDLRLLFDNDYRFLEQF